MAVPTSYTEHTLAEYMHDELGKVATLLGYAVGVADAGSYAEAVIEAQITFGGAIATVMRPQCLRSAPWRGSRPGARRSMTW